MQQISRQPVLSDLHRPSTSPIAIHRSFLEALCSKSRKIRQQMMAGASSIGLDFAVDDQKDCQPDPQEQLNWNLNDIEELWSAIIENVGMQRGQHLEQQSYSKVNDEYLLGCMMTLRSLSETLNSLFKTLTDALLGGEAYEQMKRTAELVAMLTLTLRKYRSGDPEFSNTRDLYGKIDRIVVEVPPDQSNVSKNSTAASPSQDFRLKKQTMQLTHQTKLTLKQPRSSEPSDNHLHNCVNLPQGGCDHQEYIAELKDVIQRLQSFLAENNEQFAGEVQKYNAILYEQQQELRNCEAKFLQFEEQISQLQSTIVRLKEEKHRDQLLIEYILRIFRNMSKKLRQHERQLGIPVSGAATVLTEGLHSPARSQIGTTVHSTFRSSSPKSTYTRLRGYPNRGHLA